MKRVYNSWALQNLKIYDFLTENKKLIRNLYNAGLSIDNLIRLLERRFPLP
jgi:hypothetical protein